MVRKPTAAELGAFIRKHRLARGMTQVALGGHLGISGCKVSSYEHGRNMPPAAVWLALMDVLDAPQFVQPDA